MAAPMDPLALRLVWLPAAAFIIGLIAAMPLAAARDGDWLWLGYWMLWGGIGIGAGCGLSAITR